MSHAHRKLIIVSFRNGEAAYKEAILSLHCLHFVSETPQNTSLAHGKNVLLFAPSVMTQSRAGKTEHRSPTGTTANFAQVIRQIGRTRNGKSDAFKDRKVK